MLKKIIFKVGLFLKTLSAVNHLFNMRFAYEITSITECLKTKKHIIQIKISGKSQSISCVAEDIVKDENFLLSFSPADVRAIVYWAVTDKYEAILKAEQIKKSYEIFRYKNIKGNKTIQLK